MHFSFETSHPTRKSSSPCTRIAASCPAHCFPCCLCLGEQQFARGELRAASRTWARRNLVYRPPAQLPPPLFLLDLFCYHFSWSVRVRSWGSEFAPFSLHFPFLALSPLQGLCSPVALQQLAGNPVEPVGHDTRRGLFVSPCLLTSVPHLCAAASARAESAVHIEQGLCVLCAGPRACRGP